MSNDKLQVRNLHFSYPDGHAAVKNISFTIQHGESVGIIGANGAGKSTILMLLMGVLFPKNGEVLVGDVRVTKKTLQVIRQRLGMVFQDPDDQLFMTTVYDDVA
ncbi:MAG: ABC transporter ATP-binding protein, partial [Anaerovoracaceae bacterium]